jgi:hypothetical protein
VIEDYVTPADVADAFRARGLDRFLHGGGVTPPFPTRREMIDLDQRLAVFGVDFAVTDDVVGVAAEMNGLALPGALR